MATFAELTAREDVGVCWLLEVSSDNFSTVDHRYGSHWGKLDGTNVFEARLVKVGRLQRSFSVDHGFAASSVQVVFDNVDGGVDWLCNYATVESHLFKSKFRLKMGLYEPGVPSGVQVKTLGVFTCLDFPVRQLGEISVTLADDSLNAIADLAISPSISDWLSDAGSNSSNCPLISAIGAQIDGTYMADVYTPTRLAWGVPLDAYPVMTQPDPGRSANSYATRVLMTCATRDTGTDLTKDVGSYVTIYSGADSANPNGELGLPIPVGTFNFKALSYTIFTARRTQTLSKDGKNWKLIWLEVRVDQLLDFLCVSAFDFLTQIGFYEALNGNVASGFGGVRLQFLPALNSLTSLDFIWEKISRWEVETCGSSMELNKTPSGPEIVKDLIGYYARGGDPALVDSTSFDRAIASLQSVRAGGILADFAQAAGSVSASRSNGTTRETLAAGHRFEAVGGYLRSVLTEICQSFDMDLFAQWDGTFALSLLAPDFDALTATHPRLSETKLSLDSASDRIPSTGERWSPYNRIYIDEADGSRSGPYDYGTAITSWGRVLARTISAKWRKGVNFALAKVFTPDQLNAVFSSVWGQRALEARARPVYTFRTKLEALQLELGAYFRTSWSRGLSIGGTVSPYSDVLFKVEGLSLVPETCEVEVIAVWSDDVLTDLPYLLDDEDYLLRVAASGGRTCTVTDSSTTVTFSSGNLTTDAVSAGDHLVLLDSTLAEDVFTRFRAVRIESVDSTTSLTISSADLDFDAPAGVAVAAWIIQRSQATYPADLTNYPSGNDFYGKVTDSAGLFGDSTTGNKLLDG